MDKLRHLSGAKTISICAKCSDMFGATIHDANGAELFAYDGYVPSFMPGEHYGDYVMLDIDLATGQILNWKPVTLSAIKTAIKAALS